MPHSSDYYTTDSSSSTIDTHCKDGTELYADLLRNPHRRSFAKERADCKGCQLKCSKCHLCRSCGCKRCNDFSTSSVVESLDDKKYPSIYKRKTCFGCSSNCGSCQLCRSCGCKRCKDFSKSDIVDNLGTFTSECPSDSELKYNLKRGVPYGQCGPCNAGPVPPAPVPDYHLPYKCGQCGQQGVPDVYTSLSSSDYPVTKYYKGCKACAKKNGKKNAEDSDVMKILKDGVLEKDMYNKKYKDQHKDNGTEMEIMQTMNALNTLNEMNGMNGMNEKYENYEKYDEDKNGKEDKKVKDTYNTDKIRFEVKMGSKQGHKYAKDIKGDSSIYVNGKNGPLVHLFKGNEYVFECSMNGKKLILSEVPMGKMIREVDGVKRQGDSVMIKVTDKTPRYFYYRTPENDLLGGLIIVHDRD